jgi:replicative DNA helicase
MKTQAERHLLGAMLLDISKFPAVASMVRAKDFGLQSHQLIFTRMQQLFERGEKVDRVTLANELMRFNELDTVGGLAYLVTLDDGLPQGYNLETDAKKIRRSSGFVNKILRWMGL